LLARGHQAVPVGAARAATYAMVELEEGAAARHVSLRPFIDGPLLAPSGYVALSNVRFWGDSVAKLSLRLSLARDSVA